MNAKNVIDTILHEEHTTRYRLAKRLGVHESMLSRAYNKKSDPGFNEVARWLEKLDYSISITKKTFTQLDTANAFSVDEFGKSIASLDAKNYNYLAVHRHLKQLLENYTSNPRLLNISMSPSKIQDKNWRAFFAAAVAYLSATTKKPVPAAFSKKANRAEQPWSPITNLGKSHTDFDSMFAAYNVLLPKGELEWI